MILVVQTPDLYRQVILSNIKDSDVIEIRVSDDDGEIYVSRNSERVEREAGKL